MELVETEKDYIKDLGSVVEGYMAEMQVCYSSTFIVSRNREGMD